MKNFKDKVAEFLRTLQFTEQEVDNWVFERMSQSPGTMININGVVQQVPGQNVSDRYQVSFFGPGSINPDTEQENPFWLIQFNHCRNDVKNLDTVESFYPEEIERFKQFLFEILK